MHQIHQPPENKLVTVIVPVYNSESYLDDCLSSLSNQTDDADNPVETYCVLILDDGSTDSSGAIAQRYADENPSLFTYVRHENGGVSQARNKGIDLCETEYLMFVDNDDIVESDYVWSHLEAIKESGADIVISGYKRTDGTKTFGETLTTKSPWTKYRFLAPWAKIYRTSFLKAKRLEFFENNIGEDVVFLMNAYGKTDKIESIPYAGYLWRVNDTSISNSIQRGLRDECRVDRVLAELDRVTIPQEEDLLDYFRYRYRVWYLLFSGKSASPEQFEEAAKELLSDHESKPPKIAFPLSDRIKGEPVANRMSVLLFKILTRLQAYGLFAKFYCRN